MRHLSLDFSTLCLLPVRVFLFIAFALDDLVESQLCIFFAEIILVFVMFLGEVIL